MLKGRLWRGRRGMADFRIRPWTNLERSAGDGKRAPQPSPRRMRRAGVASGTPPLYTSGNQARKAATCSHPRYPLFSTGPRRRSSNLSRPGPARGLCDARSESGGRPDVPPPLSRRLEEWIIPDLARLQRAWRAARGSRRVWVKRPDKGAGSRTRSPRSACG